MKHAEEKSPQIISTLESVMVARPIKIDPDAFYHLSEIALALSTSEAKLSQLNRQGRLPIMKDGLIKVVKGSDVIRWLSTYATETGVVPVRHYTTQSSASASASARKEGER